MNTKLFTRKLTYSALLLAVALLLPLLTGQLQQVGNKICPMHLPIFLCGFLCGWPWALGIGVIAPLLRSVLFGMPPMMPVGISMAFELATYGLVVGLLYARHPGRTGWLYASLILSMLIGRLVAGIVNVALLGFDGYSISLFFTGLFVNTIPGVVIQLILVPLLVRVLEKAHLSTLPVPQAI